ncbi:MAG: ATP-binding protein [Pseudomonadota bacterium]
MAFGSATANATTQSGTGLTRTGYAHLLGAVILGLLPPISVAALGPASLGFVAYDHADPLILGGAVALGMLLTLTALFVTEAWSSPSAASDLRQRLALQEAPTTISDASGRVNWSNRAMADAARAEGALTERLSQIVDVDPALIYRLSRSAMAVGFAFDEVERVDGGCSAALVVRLQGNNDLLWSVLPLDRLNDILPARRADTYESACFAYLRVDCNGDATVNASFRAQFGADPIPVLEKLSVNGKIVSGTRRLPSLDGAERPVRVCTSSVVVDHDGTQEIYLFPEDHVEESSIEDSPATGLAAVPVALFQLDLSGRLVWMNPPARDLFGEHLTPGVPLDLMLEPLGRPIPLLVLEATRDEARPLGEMVRLAGRKSEAFVQITLKRVRVQGEDCLLGVLTDANELRQLEDKFAQSQKMEAVGKLAGGVAHDFNNVLTAVAGHCDLLLLGKDPSHPDHSDLMQVKQNSDRAAGLVKQLLAFSRKQTLNPALLSVPDVLSDTMYLLDRLIGERVQLSVRHGDALGKVRADRQQLEQSLMNLVVNARDAMPQGGTIHITTRNRSTAEGESGASTLAPGEYVEIAVEDEGTGIDPALIDKVFDPFFTTKPIGEGTGLGLSTVYGIVKQSGGSIAAENRPDGGACFRMLLPRAEEEEVRVVPTVETPRADLTGQGAVLLVEDEAPVRAFASRALKLRGYQVTAAASAEEAMDYVSDLSHPVDLIVTDVVMPGLDGPSFAQKARGLRPGLPVVFVSGYAEESFRKNMVDPGCSFLPKPFSLSELTAKVKETLGQDA